MKELKHLTKYFKKYRTRLLIGVGVTIVARVFALVMPSYVNKSIQVVEDFLANHSTAVQAKELLLGYITLIIGAALLSGFFTFLMRQTILNVSRRIEYDLKNEIFDHYLALDLDFYKKNRTGDLMNRISEDVNQVRMYAGPALMYGIQTTILFACLLPLMFTKAPTLAAYTLLPLPILSVLIYQISRIIHKRSTRVQEFLSTLSTFVQESFSGISVIKAYSLAPKINEEMEALAGEGKNTGMTLARVNAWFFPLMLLLIGMSNIFVIYVGGQQYINGEIASIGLVAEFILYINMLTWPVAVVGWVTSMIQRAEASQKRINTFLKTPPAIKNNTMVAAPIQGNIEFQNVSFTYKDTHITALRNLSFTVKVGETVAFLGKTGAGKSTILNLVARLYEPSSGQLLIDGIPIQNVPLHSLRNAIGAVPQEAFLFSDTIANNIRFGSNQASFDEVITVAQHAAVHNDISGFDKKYDTILGERGITLSGGQQQRIAIARALLKRPQIYLFDDCLSAVDTETEEKILSYIKQVSQHKTTFIVSHRISSVKNADKIIVLEKGNIIQEGTHKQLLYTSGYYQELYRKQLSKKE